MMEAAAAAAAGTTLGLPIMLNMEAQSQVNLIS